MIWTKLTRTGAVFSRATSAVLFCAGFWIFRYAGKIPKNYIKNQCSESFRRTKGGPQGSQEGVWRGPPPGRATCPPGWVPHPPVPYFGLIYSPDSKTSEHKSLFPSTSQSRRNPLFFLGELIWRLNWPPVRGKPPPSSSSSPLHHPSMTSSIMCE